MKSSAAFGIGLLVMTALAVAAGCAAAQWYGPFQAYDGLSRIGVIVAVSVVAAAIMAVPFCIQFDRALKSLCNYLARVAADDPNAAYVGPKWMNAVTDELTDTIEHLRSNQKSLQQNLHELEIRHSVSEASRRQFEAVLNALRDGVIVTDAFNEIVMANQTAARVLDFDLESALHKPVKEVVSDEQIGRLIHDTRDSASFGDRRSVEHEIAAADDSDAMMVFDVGLSCVENHKHETAGVVTIMHDLTQEREIAKRETDFVSKASHELRTPLSSIRAYVEMLVDGEAQDEQSRGEFYQIIQNETHRLGRLIDNMLNISRIEAGIVQIDREDVDVSKLIGRAIETLEPQAREKEISLHKKLAPVNLVVEGDPDMLYQVILNLVSNAVKYTPEGGRVTLSADSDNLTRSVLVSVSDTGLGIPPDAVDQLFTKFYRVENYKRVAKGTGLGLNLCKHIVETVHHGQIGLESKLGMGSKFWFTVPMRYAGSQAAA